MAAATITNQINAINAVVFSSPKSLSPPSLTMPNTLKGVDDLIHAGFEAYRNSCFNWLLVATALVIVGVVLEGPELWHEITGIIHRWLVRRRFGISLLEVSPHNWVKIVAAIGWLLIVLGVAGEYVADSFLSKADGYVQTFDEILLTDAQRQTAFARDRASAAYERAAKTEQEAAQENALAAQAEKEAQEENAKAAKALESAETARKEAEGFQLQIAQANERAAQADQKAAEANRTAKEEQLARTRLEETLSGWKLDAEAQARVLDKIKPHPNTPFDLATNPAEYGFMEILDGLLHSANWTRQPPKSDNPLGQLLIDGKSSIWFGSGLYVEFSSTRAKDFSAPAEALVLALQAEGIPAKGHLLTNDPNPSAIHIAIGKRE